MYSASPMAMGAAACSSGTGGDASTAARATPGPSPSPDPGPPAAWTRVDLGFVAAYVLVRGNEAAVVDTGVSGSGGAIGTSLGAAGSSWSAVRHVVLTHHHPDHAGSTAEVLEQADIGRVSALVLEGAVPVALPEPEPVSPAVAAAAPSGLFRIDNACPHPMELFVEFEAAGVAPQLLRWEIAGGGRSLIVNDSAGQPITLAHGGLRYQAGLIGRDWYWRGTEPRQFDDRPLAMRDVTLAADAAGDYLLAFECAGYTEPDAGADSAAPFLTPPPG